MKDNLNFARKLWEFLVETLFPKSEFEKLLDEKSVSEILEYLPREYFERNEIVALLPFQNKTIKELISLIKYSKNSKAYGIAGEIILEYINDIFSEELPHSKIILTGIPASKKRLREHGFNQTDEIANEIIKRGGNNFLLYVPNILIRTHSGKRQTEMHSRKERIDNMNNMFEADCNSIKGKVIIVIDDLSTTGATLIDAHRALRKEGAKKVYCIALAH